MSECLSKQAEIDALESLLRQETDKYIDLKQTIDKDMRDKGHREREMLNYSREADFYKKKLSQADTDKFETKIREIKVLAREVMKKRDKLRKLHETLSQFNGLEPSNDAIKAKIEELKKKRLSLEMSFVEL